MLRKRGKEIGKKVQRERGVKGEGMHCHQFLHADRQNQYIEILL